VQHQLFLALLVQLAQRALRVPSVRLVQLVQRQLFLALRVQLVLRALSVRLVLSVPRVRLALRALSAQLAQRVLLVRCLRLTHKPSQVQLLTQSLLLQN
jgi:hypothetical protein